MNTSLTTLRNIAQLPAAQRAAEAHAIMAEVLQCSRELLEASTPSLTGEAATHRIRIARSNLRGALLRAEGFA